MEVTTKATGTRFKYSGCEWCVQNVGSINFWANLGLAVFKLYCGLFGGSRALIADAMHSVTDVLVSILLIIGIRVSGKPADESHPYGHGKVEFIAAAFIGLLLLAVAVIITVDALVVIISGEKVELEMIAVWAAVISVVANYILYKHSMCLGEQIGSPAIIANARENLADALSSFAALVGILGALMGIPFFDPLGAIAVAFFIVKAAVNTVSEASRGLMDLNLSQGEVRRIKKIAASVDAVQEVTFVRGRMTGPRAEVEIEIELAPETTVGRLNEIAEEIKKRVMRGIRSVEIVSVRARGGMGEAHP